MSYYSAVINKKQEILVLIYNTSNGSIYSNGSNVPYGMNDIAKERPEYYVAQRGERER